LPFSQPADAGVIAFGSGGNTFNMEFVAIGNPGNADDTTGAPNPAGSVAYAYNMGKYEVSDDMITNYNSSYGTANSLAITTSNRGGAKPATSVSWNEAARFTNWLNTSTGGSAAYKFTIGSGVNDNIALWGSGDAGYDALNPYRNSLATYVLPSMDEWYKAAYYNPTTSTYFDYATGSNSAPTAVASGTAANTAVYGQTFAQGPADVNLAGGLSPYGIMGLGGNVFEWEETSLELNNSSGSSVRVIRGGSWSTAGSSNLSSSTRASLGDPALEIASVGFRVASLSSSAAAVPEPGSFAVLTLLGITGAAYRKRKRK
jgi:formylglycine-generating enzyme required for sulfatase activity